MELPVHVAANCHRASHLGTRAAASLAENQLIKSNKSPKQRLQTTIHSNTPTITEESDGTVWVKPEHCKHFYVYVENQVWSPNPEPTHENVLKISLRHQLIQLLQLPAVTRKLFKKNLGAFFVLIITNTSTCLVADDVYM